MYTFIVVLTIFIGAALATLVLIQNPNGGGLGTVGRQILGVRPGSNVVEKLTWSFAASLVLFCFLATFFITKGL